MTRQAAPQKAVRKARQKAPGKTLQKSRQKAASFGQTCPKLAAGANWRGERNKRPGGNPRRLFAGN